MSKTIIQKVIFKNISPEILFGIYVDSKKHSAAIGGETKITAKEGAAYAAWNSYITGKNLKIVKNRMIAQTWRSTDFLKEDADSILIITFDKNGNDTLMQMTHANVPDHQYEQVKEGWNEYYWKPWKNYLLKNKK